MLSHIREAVDYISNLTGFVPEAGIIPGYGLNAIVHETKVVFTLPYTDIPNFPSSVSDSGGGNLLLGFLNGVKVMILQTPFNFSEGSTMQDIVFPVRVMGLLGIKKLFLTNAVTGLNPDFQIGDLMIIDDHINLMCSNPLIGKNIDALGPRFPDMSAPYDPTLINLARAVANDFSGNCHVGVYTAFSENIANTRSQQEYLRFIGSDCIGTDVVPEVIAARHMGIKVFATSVIMNIGSQMLFQPDEQDQAQVNSRISERNLVFLLKQLVQA